MALHQQQNCEYILPKEDKTLFWEDGSQGCE